MAVEKYVSREEAEEAKRAPLGLRLRKEPPSIAPHFLEEVRKYLEREYGSQRIYQGGLRVYTTLDPGMQRAGVRALRDGLRALDRRARGFVKPEASLLVGRAPAGAPAPRRVGLALRRGRRGARGRDRLRPDDRGRPDRRLPGAALPRRRRLDPAHEPGRGAAARDGGAVPRRLALRDRRPQGGGGPARAGAEGRGRAAGPRRALGRGAGHGRRLRLREEQVQPRDAGPAAGGLRLQARRLRGGAGDARLDPVHDPRRRARSASRTPGTRRSGRRRTTTGPTWGRSRSAARWSRAGTSPR